MNTNFHIPCFVSKRIFDVKVGHLLVSDLTAAESCEWVK